MSAINIFQRKNSLRVNKYRHICIGNVSVGALSSIYSTAHRARFQGVYFVDVENKWSRSKVRTAGNVRVAVVGLARAPLLSDLLPFFPFLLALK